MAANIIGLHQPYDSDPQIREYTREHALSPLEMLQRTVGSLDTLQKMLDERPGAVVGGMRPRAIIDGRLESAVDQEAERQRWLKGMRDIVSVLQERQFDVKLNKEQELAVRAINVLVGRPTLLIRKGKFDPPPPNWEDLLNRYRALIEPTFRSVGKIELSGRTPYAYVGTGFIVAKDVLMTNRHVVKLFCDQDGAEWTLRPGVSAAVDFVEEYGNSASNEFAVEGVVGVHDKHDLALLRLAAKSRQRKNLPKPLPVAKDGSGVTMGHDVYAVGYPARSNDADLEMMNRLFGDTFELKRVSPGQVMGLLEGDPILLHDCTTLGGNSGSCILDMVTQRVVGLHFGGAEGAANIAVALWKLADDPLLEAARVNFV
jgi:V8-like Glu-specific endopeptidase